MNKEKLCFVLLDSGNMVIQAWMLCNLSFNVYAKVYATQHRSAPASLPTTSRLCGLLDQVAQPAQHLTKKQG